MKDAPNIYQIDNLLRQVQNTGAFAEVTPGVWVPARSAYRIGGLWVRLKAAWIVFTGEADALLWRGQ